MAIHRCAQCKKYYKASVLDPTGSTCPRCNPGESPNVPIDDSEVELQSRLPRPLHDRIIVRRTEEVAAPIGGIIIPDAAKEKPQQGVVIAVGPGSMVNGLMYPLDVRVEDTILFGKYSGTEIKLNGEDLLIMREEEVFCIL